MFKKYLYYFWQILYYSSIGQKILSHTKWGKRLDAYEWYVLVVLLQETGAFSKTVTVCKRKITRKFTVMLFGRKREATL